MFHSFEEAQAFLREQNIRQIDLKWCDLWGRWHHITLSARAFTPVQFSEGVGFDGSAVGFKSVSAGDMALIPDLSSGFLDPFFEDPTLSFICDVVEPDSKAAFRLDPRSFAKRAQQYLSTFSAADASRWGPEFEFFVFDNVHFENSQTAASYRLGCAEADWNGAGGDNSYMVPKHQGYHRIPPSDRFSNLRSRMSRMIEDAGVPVKYHHHEAGGPGHCEIETPLMGLLAAGDAVMLIKHITKQAARQAGFSASFLPKPMYGEAGNGMHFHQHLFLGDQNAFYDPDGPHLLSQTALYYIGGLLTHAPAVLAFTNPSTNSYRRLVPGFEAPINCFFGSADRSAAIRIPKYATDPSEVRMEFRPPDATCNPYLAMSAMLLAGLDGICSQIDPSEAGFGPFSEDIFSWPEEKRSRIKSLPTSLDATMDALEADYQFLLQGGVFDEEMIHLWAAAKRKEHRETLNRPHPYEVEAYFDF